MWKRNSHVNIHPIAMNAEEKSKSGTQNEKTIRLLELFFHFSAPNGWHDGWHGQVGDMAVVGAITAKPHCVRLDRATPAGEVFITPNSRSDKYYVCLTCSFLLHRTELLHSHERKTRQTP